MKLKRSEIFENFAKIALEKGLIENKIISKAEAMTQEDKYKDSEYKKNIEALYHVDLDKVNILESAHPKTVIVGPSYDKVNSVVENLTERHNVMVGIVNKTPGSDNPGVKYASSYNDLLLELVRVGYSMDNKNQDDLRILADSCSTRITKEAFLPLAVGIAGGVAAVVALIAIINHTTPSDQGVYNNCEKAILEINELKPKLPQIGKNIDALIKDLQFLQELSSQYNHLDGVDASTPEKLVESANRDKAKFDLVKKYKSSCSYMAGEIDQYIQMIDSYKANEDRSYDWWQKIKNVTEYITGNDKEDAVLALKTLKDSLTESVSEANHFMELARQQAPSLIAAISKYNPDAEVDTFNQHQDSVKSQNANSPAKQNSKPIHNDAEELTNATWQDNEKISLL